MKSLLSIITIGALATSLHALDVRFGKGDFKASAGMKNFCNMSVKTDIDVFAINEQHAKVYDRYYLFGNLDIYSSNTVRTHANYMNQLMNTQIVDFPVDWPFDTPNDFIGQFVPVPSSYEVQGVDFDIGMGMDIVQNKAYYLGAGVVTGVSTPFMKMENYAEAANFFMDMLEKTRTDMKTYKAGLSLQAGYNPTKVINLYATGIYAYQTGEVSNSIVNSSMDTDGTYTSLDIGVRINPLKLSKAYKHNFLSNVYVTLGYMYKNWEVDSMKGNVMGFNTPDVMNVFDVDFESNYTYFGIGYNF